MRISRALAVLAIFAFLVSCSKREQAATAPKGATMDRAGFWRMIGEARAGSNDEAFLFDDPAEMTRRYPRLAAKYLR